MTGKMKSYVLGLLSSLAGKHRPTVGMEEAPRACLYNGVKLPNIYKVYTPEWRKTHPFACIYQSGTRYCFEAFRSNARYSDINWSGWTDGYTYFGCNEPGVWEGIKSGYGVSANADEWPALSFTTGRVTCSQIIWANFDVRKNASELYLTASEPIPVYE